MPPVRAVEPSPRRARLPSRARGKMEHDEETSPRTPIRDRDREIAALRDRLSRLSAASLRINETLDFDVLLQEVVDSARALTGSRYAALTVFGEADDLPDFIVSGLSPQEQQGLWDMPEGLQFFEYLSGLAAPLRVADIGAHVRALGMPEFIPSVPIVSLLVAPVRHGGVGVGTIYLGKGEVGDEFTQEDEDFVVMFAVQAALVIANARKHRQERRARTDMETLVDTSPVAVLVFDARTGELASHNQEARRIAGEMVPMAESIEEVLAVLRVRRADGTEMQVTEIPLQQEMSAGERVRVEEIVMEAPDDRKLTVLMNATPIRAEGGSVETFVITLQDMTPMEDLERLRAEFLGMVSHELRTPLSSVKGSVTNLLDPSASLDPAEVAQFHRIIDAQTDRMRDLISDLLDVARIQTGSLSVSPVPADLAALVDEAKSTFLSGGGRNNIRIELPPGLPVVIADRRRIVQVIGNLLSNASRHSPTSSVIRILAEREDPYVRVSVIDEGRGIDADSMPHLFRKFSRFDAEDSAGDTGLGLAICKGIVEAHGGRIWAESDGPGLGARFTFTLPADGEAGTLVREETPSAAVRSPRSGTDRPRILAVDDDPQTLRYVRDVLSKAGYAVTVTADPEEVSRLVEEEEPSLVLLDLMLPGSNGIELMEVVQAMANAPIIFLSAYGQDEVIARAFEKGAVDYIVKPFSPTELAARIQAALRKRDPPALDLPGDPYVLGDLVIDYSRRGVTVGGVPVELTPLEYRLLVELSANAGRLITHEQLLRRVWGQNNSGGSGPVRTYVKRLRQKLGDDPNDPAYIFTKRRVGYWMEKGEEQEDL